MEHEKGPSTRRDVLKSTAGIGAVTVGCHSVSGLAAADPTQFVLGTVRFIELLEEYDVPEETPKMVRTGKAGYAVDGSRNVITLTNAPVPQFTSNDVVVAAGGDIHSKSQPITITNSERILPVETNYRRLNAKYAVLDERRQKRPIRVRSTETGVQVTTPGDTSLHAADGQEVKAVSDIEDITLRGLKAPTTVEHTIRVRNRGRVTVYGHEDYLVLPLGSSDSYAQARVSSILSVIGDEASKLDGVGLVVVPKDVDITTGVRGE